MVIWIKTHNFIIRYPASFILTFMVKSFKQPVLRFIITFSSLLITVAMYAQVPLRYTGKVAMPVNTVNPESALQLPGNVFFTQTQTKRDSACTYSLSHGDSSLVAKTIYFYDQNGRNIQSFSTKYEYLGQITLEKHEYTYDDYGNIIRHSTFSSSQENPDVWLETAREEYAFDSAGNQIMKASYMLWGYPSPRFEGIDKRCYVYNDKKQVVESEYYRWDTLAQTWKKDSQIEYAWYDNVKLKSQTYYAPDSTGNVWNPKTKIEFGYNSLDLEILWSSSSYRSDGTWFVNSKYITDYDTVNYTAITYGQTYNYDSARWDTTSRKETTYCSHNWKCFTAITQIRSNPSDTWLNDLKETQNWMLLDNGYWHSRFLYGWIQTDSCWDSSPFGYTQSYDTLGNRTSFATYSFSIYPDFKDTALYRADGKPVFKINYDHWDPDQSLWQSGNKKTYEYDTGPLLVLLTEWSFNPPDTWTPQKRTWYNNGDFVLPDTSTYNLQGTLYASLEDAKAYQWFDCQNGEEISGADKYWFAPAISGEYAVRITYQNYIVTSGCRSIVASSVQDTKDKLFLCYPNPTDGKIYLDFYQPDIGNLVFRITDLSGRIVQAQSCNNPSAYHKTIDLSGLREGMYFLQIVSDGQITGQEKIIIEK